MIRKLIRNIYYHYTPTILRNLRLRIIWKLNKKISERDKKIRLLIDSNRPIRILFVVSSLPMWRCQNLYDLLQGDCRFDVRIVVCPFKRYLKQEAIKYSDQISQYFESRHISVLRVIDEDFNLGTFLNSDFNPDIVIPSQYYGGVYGNELDFNFNKHRLYCHIPYALLTINDEFAYNLEFHNICWKFYLPTPLHYETARRMMVNKAQNVKIVGEPDFDKFQAKCSDPWKKIEDKRVRKRIIWAPHFSINPNSSLHRTSFLWLYDEMLKIAEEYKDRIQIAFKPHPILYNVLVKGWGKEKADVYYNKWSTINNTQLEEGNFIDLFKYSDAMIHDSGSFTGEYIFVNKPVMFTTEDIEGIRKGANDFGLKCLDLHYIGKNINDVRSFIEETVLKDKDTMQEARSKFYQEYLIPPNNTSVAMNIYNDLLDSFGFSRPDV